MKSSSLPLSDHYSFETPEQIDVSYAVAGIGSRFMAALVDSIIIAAALFLILVPGTLGSSFLIGFVMRLFGRHATGNVVAFALAGTGFLSFCVIAFYYVLLEAFWQGQTPGKRWLGIRVIRDGGYPISFSTSVIRNLIRIVDFLPFYYMIGIVVMFIDRKSRRLGDLAAGTIVVKEQKGVKLETLDSDARILSTQPAWGDSFRPPIRDLRGLSADDRRLLREYLRRRETIDPEAADRIGRSLARTFATKTSYELGNELPSRFLERLARAIDAESE
jgi:uncharacterized RDD family membrane protein YckC